MGPMVPPRNNPIRPLVPPTVLLVLLCAAAFFEGPLLRRLEAWWAVPAQLESRLGVGLQVALWLAAAFFAHRLLRVVLIDGAATRALGGPPPRLLSDVAAVLLLVLAAAGIARFVFNEPITAFWATSSVVGIVLGIALQSAILDVFTGIAINFDQSYRIGEWISVSSDRDPYVTGEVVGVTWRTTRIRTVEDNLVVIPNSRIGLGVITNLSRPVKRQRRTVHMVLDYDVPVDRARRVMAAGVRAMTHPEGPLAEPAPAVLVESADADGVNYRIDYWQADNTGFNGPRSRVLEGILRHLNAAGISSAYPKRDVYTAAMPVRQHDGRSVADRVELMRRVDLFAQLAPEKLQALATGCRACQLRAGETLLRAGAEGASMHVLFEGLLEVRAVPPGATAEQPVAVLQPGEFLGEASLLTGEPRAATVVALTDAMTWEITKDQLEPVLRSDPPLAAVLARTLAERQAANALRSGGPEPTAAQTENNSRQILARIVKVFRGVYGSLSDSPFGSRSPGGPAK